MKTENMEKDLLHDLHNGGPQAEYMRDPKTGKRISKTPHYRSPFRRHIPLELDRPWAAEKFPWRPVGYQIILMMIAGSERMTEAGIILPDVAQGEGKDKRKTTGIVLAHGAGELLPNVGYASVTYDYGIGLGDIVFVQPNSGQVIHDEDKEYRVITPHEVIMKLRRDMGSKTRDHLVAAATKAIKSYEGREDEVGYGTAPAPQAVMPDRPSWEMGVEEAQEEMRRQMGQKTKSQIVVPGRKK